MREFVHLQRKTKKIINQNQSFSENGLRVLAFAYREFEEGDELSMDDEYHATFSGLVSMIDPPRVESMEAVADAISAGIKPVMITGDHKVTATAIAKQIGIYKDGDLSVTGQELDKMTGRSWMRKSASSLYMPVFLRRIRFVS